MKSANGVFHVLSGAKGTLIFGMLLLNAISDNLWPKKKTDSFTIGYDLRGEK